MLINTDMNDKKSHAFLILGNALFICSNKWILEGIINLPFIEALILMISCISLLFLYHGKISTQNMIWLIYAANILFSVMISGPTRTTLGRASIMISIVLISTFGKVDSNIYKRLFYLLLVISIFHSLFVIIHYILGSTFNNFYFNLLDQGDKYLASSYYNKGYYFGVLYSPHEVAGIISFTIAGVAFRSYFFDENKIKNYIVIIFLLIPLLLTGKKGVLGITLLNIILIDLILNKNKKKWHRIFFTIVLSFIALYLLNLYITANPDNVLFYRITQFLDRLSKGHSVDSGRVDLINIAIREFKDNRLLGIGWSKFVTNSVGDYGYETGHQVNLDYLQWLTETGIIGFIACMIPLVLTFRHGIYVFKRIDSFSNSNDKWLITYAFFLQVFTLVYAFIETPFYDIYFFTCYMFSSAYLNRVYTLLKYSRKQYCKTIDKSRIRR